MGFKTLTPAQVTTLTPAAKEVHTKVFKIARTDTASAVKVKLPAQASIVAVVRQGSVASDAGTTATVTITAANNSGTISTKADDVKGSGATTGFVTMSNLPNVESMPQSGDISISAVYAETGVAATTGGPWNYIVQFVV